MRLIQEIVFSLMIVVGVSMIVYDVINARSVARAAERKTFLTKQPAASLTHWKPSIESTLRRSSGRHHSLTSRTLSNAERN